MMNQKIDRNNPYILTGIMHHNKLPLFVATGMIVTLALQHIIYILYVDNGVVNFDFWRFILSVDNFFSGNFNLREFIVPSNGPLKSLLTPLLVTGDALLFDLNLNSLYIGAVLIKVFSTMPVVWTANRVAKKTGVWAILPVTAIGVVLVSPTLFHLIAYGQATVSIYRVAMYVIIFWIVGESLKTDTSSNTLLIIGIIIAVSSGVLLVGSAYLPGFAGSILITVMVATIGKWRRGEKIRTPILILVTLTVSLIIYWFTMVIALDTARAASWGFSFLKSNPEAGMIFYLRLLATSLIGPGAAKASSLGTQLVVGCVAMVSMGIGIFFALRRTFLGFSGLSLCLFLYSAMTMVLMTIARAWLYDKGAFAGRYLSDTPLWQAGILLLMVETIGTSLKKRNSTSMKKILMILSVSLIVFIVHFASLLPQWKGAPLVAKNAKHYKEVILHSHELTNKRIVQDLRCWMENPRVVRKGIKTLQRWELNVFNKSNDKVRSEKNKRP
jgi:hypothetical protein